MMALTGRSARMTASSAPGSPNRWRRGIRSHCRIEMRRGPVDEYGGHGSKCGSGSERLLCRRSETNAVMALPFFMAPTRPERTILDAAGIDIALHERSSSNASFSSITVQRREWAACGWVAKRQRGAAVPSVPASLTFFFSPIAGFGGAMGPQPASCQAQLQGWRLYQLTSRVPAGEAAPKPTASVEASRAALVRRLQSGSSLPLCHGFRNAPAKGEKAQHALWRYQWSWDVSYRKKQFCMVRTSSTCGGSSRRTTPMMRSKQKPIIIGPKVHHLSFRSLLLHEVVVRNRSNAQN